MYSGASTKKELNLLMEGLAISRRLEEASSSSLVPTMQGGIKRVMARNIISDKIVAHYPVSTLPQEDVTALMQFAALRLGSGVRGDVLGGLMTLLSTVFDNFLDQNETKEALAACGIQCKVEKVTTLEQLGNIRCKDPDVEEKVFQYLGIVPTDERARLHVAVEKEYLSMEGTECHPKHCLAFTGVLLCLMIKTLGQNNLEKWRTKRWEVMCGCIGIDKEQGGAFKVMPLTVEKLKNVMLLFSTAQIFRRNLFKIICDYAEIENDKGRLCYRVLKYLKWAELTHIGLINKYIFQQHPQLIYMPELRVHVENFIRALVRMTNLQQNDALWAYKEITCKKCEVDFKKKEIEFLNRSNFTLLIAIAVEIRKCEATSLTNYHKVGNWSAVNRKIRDKALKLSLSLEESDSTSCRDSLRAIMQKHMLEMPEEQDIDV